MYKKRVLIQCIIIPLAVGVVSALLSRGGMEAFAVLNKPPLSPPGWLFPVVWTILYILMGISSYIILTSGAAPQDIKRALTTYALQLAVNFFWSIFFFRLEWYLFSFFWLVFLWALILLMEIQFYRIAKVAAYLNLLYLVWVAFAGYLNLGIWWLN